MRKILQKGLFAAVLLVCSTAVFGADRIAVIDLAKVFRNYYKSRIAEDTINQRAEAVRTYLGQLRSQLVTLQNEANKLAMNVSNPALSEAERTKLRQDAAAALRRVKAKEAEIELFIAENKRDMVELENRKRQEIMSEIRREVSRRAAAEGYSFVLDSSGQTLNGQPALVIYPAKNDITESVLRELNRTAGNPANRGEGRK